MLFNGKVYKKAGDDLSEIILSMKPELMLTDAYLTLKYKKHIIERKLSKIQSHKLFNDEEFREVFINNLMIQEYDRA